MRLAALAAALLLVLAGCGGGANPVPEPANASTPASGGADGEAGDVTVVGGNLPVDPTVVFDRVLNLTGEQAAPPRVYVESADDAPSGADPPKFWRALGITPHNESDPTGPHVRTHAATGGAGESVTVYEWVLDDPALTESTLAHEFVHVVQFRNGWLEAALRQQASDGTVSYDAGLTHYMLQEGASVYVQSAYERRYLPERRTAMAHQRAAYENTSAYARLLLARYHFGAEYVAERVDSPADLATVHHNPPISTEQVLHNSTDPVENVTVRVDGMGNWTVQDRDRMGELFLRIALRTELSKSTAVDAAAGWGGDQRVTFARSNATGTAWVIHWDDSANATEFETAFERYLDAKATERDGVWHEDDGSATYRLERPSDETTVLLLGDKSFVRNVRVTGVGADDVEIEVAENRSV